MEQIARALAEYALKESYEALGVLCGNVSLNGARKSAAMNTPSGGNVELREVALAEIERERNALLGYVCGGVYVLEIAEGGSSRGKNAFEIFSEIARLERGLLLCNALVFSVEMKRAEDCAVTNLLAESGNILHQLFSARLAEYGNSELCRNSLHFRGNSGVIGSEVGVVAAGVDNAKAVARAGHIKINLFNDGSGGVGKVDGNDTACRASDLIHKSAGLAEELGLGLLRDLRDGNEINAAVVVEMRKHKSYHIFKSRGRGKSRALENA